LVALVTARQSDADVGQQARAHACAETALAIARRHARATNEIVEALDEVTEEAQALRMRPLRPMLEALQRAGREAARAEGKRVNVETRGGDVEVDARVLDTVVDPLVQIVRNAVSHGIETAEERIAAGKSDFGLVSVVATAASGRARIAVTDDGRGIDTRSVLARAVRLGLVPSGDVDGMTAGRALALIFAPGFSTLEAATGTAGRGVGLDIARDAVESVRGTITVESELGRGASFVLDVPAALSALRVLLVQEEGRTYAMPIGVVSEVLPALRSAGEGALAPDAAGDGAPARLRDLLAGQRVKGGAAGALLRIADARTVVAVEQVRGDDEVVVRPLPAGLAAHPWARGVSATSSGESVLVIDPVALLAAQR
jgi:two-component system chemotaxis sensor kinase CheA